MLIFVQFVEPKAVAANIIHYDLFSAPWEEPTIRRALETYEPTLTGRFILTQHTKEDGYSTVLYHPGVQLPSHLETDRHDLAEIVMSINPFLKRAARAQTEPLAVYLYDMTSTELDGTPPEFLGGVEVKYEFGINDSREVILLNETEYATLQNSKLYYERYVAVGGRIWSTVVVAPPSAYEQDTLFIILCGVMIFAASLLLAWIWIAHNKHRENQVNEIVDKAAAESNIVSSLFPEAVRERMIREQRESRMGRAPEQPLPRKDTFLKKDDNGSDVNIFQERGEGLEEKTREGIYKTKPLADRYEATTIM